MRRLRLAHGMGVQGSFLVVITCGVILLAFRRRICRIYPIRMAAALIMVDYYLKRKNFGIFLAEMDVIMNLYENTLPIFMFAGDETHHELAFALSVLE